jgi:hypothetical protein
LLLLHRLRLLLWLLFSRLLLFLRLLFSLLVPRHLQLIIRRFLLLHSAVGTALKLVL